MLDLMEEEKMSENLSRIVFEEFDKSVSQLCTTDLFRFQNTCPM
jgi:hypothetical protein